MPALNRGTPVKEPVLWTRGVTPPVEYTGRPLQAPPLPTLSKWAKRKQHQADVRLRRALVDAWADPERAQKDLNAAGLVYNELLDAQGLANVFMAHAQTRLANAHHVGWGQQVCTRHLSLLSLYYTVHLFSPIADISLRLLFSCVRSQLSVPESNMAHEEYTHAHVLYTALLDTRPIDYSPKRQVSVHKVAVDQFMRPIPLHFDAEDTRAADQGAVAPPDGKVGNWWPRD